MISLSTCWRSHSGMRGRALVDLIRSLGFQGIEVEYRLSREQLREVESEVDEGRIRVDSVHNFVPRVPGEGDPSDGGDRFLLSALSEPERREAVRKTGDSLRVAGRLGARVVILHLGRVEVRTAPGLLLDRVRSGEGNSEEARRLRAVMERERRESAERHVMQVLRSVQELQESASELGLRLGLENRYYYHQIPAPSELEMILEASDPNVVFYWHDAGHAQVLENIGMRRHTEYLERAGGRILGMHLHDVVGPDDHMAPSSGGFDFGILRPWWKPDRMAVMEVHATVTEEEVRKGRRFLESLGF